MEGDDEMIGAELLRYDKNRKYLVADFETTGLNLGYALPWQVSYAVFTMDKIIEEHDFLIFWPDLKMSVGAARVTGFNYEGYKQNAIDPEMVLKSLDAYLYDENIYPMGHNFCGYDCMIHGVWRRRLGLEEDYSYLERAYDTVALSKAYKKGIKLDRENMQASQMKALGIVERGLKTNLAAMGKELHISFDENGLHNSLNDIRLNIEVFRQLVWKLEI